MENESKEDDVKVEMEMLKKLSIDAAHNDEIRSNVSFKVRKNKITSWMEIEYDPEVRSAIVEDTGL